MLQTAFSTSAFQLVPNLAVENVTSRTDTRNIGQARSAELKTKRIDGPLFSAGVSRMIRKTSHSARLCNRAPNCKHRRTIDNGSGAKGALRIGVQACRPSHVSMAHSCPDTRTAALPSRVQALRNVRPRKPRETVSKHIQHQAPRGLKSAAQLA